MTVIGYAPLLRRLLLIAPARARLLACLSRLDPLAQAKGRRHATVAAVDENRGALVREVGPWALAAPRRAGIIVGASVWGPGGPRPWPRICTDRFFSGCALGGRFGGHLLAVGDSRMPTSGGTRYIAAFFGPLTGYVAGTLFWVGGMCLACGSMAAAPPKMQ